MMYTMTLVLEETLAATAKKGVPAGFKLTEVGVIPEDWIVEPLENYTSFISYGFTNPMPTTVSGPYMITAKDISNGQIQYKNARKTGIEAFNKLLTAKSRPKENDLLLTKDGTLGQLALVDHRVICINQSIAILRPNNRVNPQLLKFILESSLYQKMMLDDAGGSTIKHIYITIVNKMLVGIPPNIQEQNAIAEALSDVDNYILESEQLLAKKKAIKTATMQQLLTGKTRLPQFALRDDGAEKGYKKSALGDIPEDWDISTYGQVFSFLPTSTNARSDLSDTGEYGYIHYGDIHTKWSNHLNLDNSSFPRISSDLVSSSFIEDGDLIMADASEDYAGIGKSIEIQGVRDNKIVSGLHTYLLRDVNNIFVNGFRGYLHCIRAVKANIDRLATGMKVFGVSKNNLKTIPIPVPPKEEQIAIAAILSDMDKDIQTLQQRLDKTRQLKQGMMQELLTGKTRLI